MEERVGKYKLLERIGEGGMGEVYRARSESSAGFSREVALKLIRREVAADPRMRDLFLREGRALAAVRHRGVVQVLELDSVDERLYLAMEYLEGVDLRRLLTAHGGRLPWPTAAFIASEVALALGAAHALRAEGAETGLVHRDLSPSNVMVCRDGAVKVLDFGLARPAGAEQSVSGLQGKVHYAAPEAIVGTAVDHRADLYALGVVLYESLTGRQPFGGATDFDTMNQVLRAPVQPPSSLQAGLPAELDAVVLKAMARDRAARYASGDELARALAAVVGDRCRAADLPALLPHKAREPATAPSGEVPSGVARSGARPRRRAVLTAGVVLGAAALAAAGLSVAWPWRAAQPVVVVTPDPHPAPAPKPALNEPAEPPKPRAMGVLVVVVDRADAQIEVDGRVLATRADRARVDLPAGTPHEVKVTAPGARPFRRSVTVGEGGTIEVSASLRSPPKRPVAAEAAGTDDDQPINPLAPGRRK